MQKAWCFSVLAAGVLAAALWVPMLRASPGVVHLTDGTQVSGDVNDNDPKQVTITIHGVQEVFPRDSVDSIEYPGNIDDQYNAKIGNLAPRDVTGRLAVARWALDQRRYDLARRATAEALDIDHANAAAADLMRTITYQATLTTGAAEHNVATQPVSSSAEPLNAEHVETVKSRYLNEDQINRIRQVELKPDDQVRVAFNKDVRRRFLAMGLADSTTFYELNPTAQALEILTKGDPSMAADVRILSDPAAIAEFRGGAARVQPIILGGCAVSGCHNATAAAGGFVLSTNDESPAAAYSNFCTLQSYYQPATTLEMRRSMIDRTYPEKSLLLQYCLPQQLTDTPHPEARNFHSLFGGRNDPRYQSFLHWITYVLKPDGGIYAGINDHPTTEPIMSPPKIEQSQTTLPSQPAGN
jgi:hypothetical protein